MSYHIAKGVFDILPKEPDPEGEWRESHLWQYFEARAREVAELYGFREIRTPLFEQTELFTRAVGTGTDIVSKEMYSFKDKGDRNLSLRPEGTAPVMRAFIEKRLDQISPIHKFYYLYPMFRYERQQAGRYRQHHQFGVEAIGSSSPLQDVEGIDLLYTFLSGLGLRNLTLQLNSIGEKESREHYKKAFKEYLKPHFSALSEESKERFETNPLRILDTKNLEEKKILEEAPSILDFLDEASKEHFAAVCAHLNVLGLPYKINPALVRGLDYYNRTVFEITANELGAQNSLGGGGRYDGLLKQMGGPDLPSFGFGIGLERVIQTCLAQKIPLPKPPRTELFLIPLGDEAMERCFKLMTDFRKSGKSVEMDFSGKKLKNAMRYADQMKARFVIVMGEEELKSGQLQLKEMETGNVETVSIENLGKRLHHG